MAVIETERLILREFTTADAAFLLELLNAPNWLQFIGDRGVRTKKDAVTYILQKFIDSYKRLGFGFYLTQLKQEDVPIGMCGIIKRDYLEDVDIGFAFLPAFTGKGYAFEAASATLAFAKKQYNLNRIVAVTDADNLSSINLLKKLGMQYEKMVSWPEKNNSLLLFVKQMI